MTAAAPAPARQARTGGMFHTGPTAGVAAHSPCQNAATGKLLRSISIDTHRNCAAFYPGRRIGPADMGARLAGCLP
jgi:hypothetical protein